jgi:hypothetical protein
MCTKHIRLIVIGWLLLFVVNVAAQQPAPDPTGELESLRMAISKLRAVDRDPNTPADIRAFNREVLLEKEARLRPLLEAKKKQWRGYLSDKAGDLSEEQIRRIETTISELDAESGQMIVGTQPMPAAASAEEQIQSPAQPPVSHQAGPAASNDSQGGQGVAPSGGQDTSSSGPQSPPTVRPQTLDDALTFSANQIQAARASDPNSGAAKVDLLHRDFNLVALTLLTQKAKTEAVTDAENARTDKQVGSNEAQSGTTSLVSKGGIPAVLGFAVENGALTRSVDGTSITFSLNPVGLVSTLAQRGFITSYQTDTSFDRFLRNFALNFSFDASRGNTGGVFTGGGQQLSGLSVRYNLVNRRDPRDRRYTDAFVNLARNQGVAIAGDYRNLINQAFRNPPPSVVEWEQKTNEALQRAAPGQEKSVLQEQINKFPLSDLPPGVEVTINSLARDLAGFRQARDELLKQVSSALVMTLEYNLERRPGLPDLSNLRFIAEKGPYGGKIDLTFNSSISFFHSQPAGANTNRVHDFRFAGQLDVPFGDVARTGKFLLSFAGRYERLTEDENLPSGGILTPKGDIAVGQLKLTIPVRGTAFKIPLSVSFANRTELIQEREVRGNFGFTFDLDSIFAKFNPFKP